MHRDLASSVVYRLMWWLKYCGYYFVIRVYCVILSPRDFFIEDRVIGTVKEHLLGIKSELLLHLVARDDDK